MKRLDKSDLRYPQPEAYSYTVIA